ncbi:hypothetical protein [Enterococcus nangangensis]|uniref:hypothetical protein n=1 Tax=Enterococcus nangangensis TaxID=2559926 RepID=UPI0010F97879|nr:hypothetical protein [Enterococcus nangangensis]
MSKKTFTAVRLIIYFLALIQLQFNFIPSKIVTIALIVIAVAFVLYDLLDILRYDKKVHEDATQAPKKAVGQLNKKKK